MIYIPWYLTLVRLIVPISILRFPLLGILTSIGADASDWIFVGVISSEMNMIYQHWDKAMDVYSFLFIVWIVYTWQDIWVPTHRGYIVLDYGLAINAFLFS